MPELDTPNVDTHPLEDFWTPERKELGARIRATISDAYYEARNAGRTMEQAADDAKLAVMRILAEEGLA